MQEPKRADAVDGVRSVEELNFSFVGDAQIADDAEELLIGWADTRHAAERLDAEGFADLLALTDVFQNMLRNNITKALTQSITKNMVHMDAITNRLDAQIILLKDPTTQGGAAELKEHMPEWINGDNVHATELELLENAILAASGKTAPENIAIVVDVDGGVLPDTIRDRLKAAKFEGKVYVNYALRGVHEDKDFSDLSRPATLKLMAETIAASTQLGLSYIETAGDGQERY